MQFSLFLQQNYMKIISFIAPLVSEWRGAYNLQFSRAKRITDQSFLASKQRKLLIDLNIVFDNYFSVINILSCLWLYVYRYEYYTSAGFYKVLWVVLCLGFHKINPYWCFLWSNSCWELKMFLLTLSFMLLVQSLVMGKLFTFLVLKKGKFIMLIMYI